MGRGIIRYHRGISFSKCTIFLQNKRIFRDFKGLLLKLQGFLDSYEIFRGDERSIESKKRRHQIVPTTNQWNSFIEGPQQVFSRFRPFTTAPSDQLTPTKSLTNGRVLMQGCRERLKLRGARRFKGTLFVQEERQFLKVKGHLIVICEILGGARASDAPEVASSTC